MKATQGEAAVLREVRDDDLPTFFEQQDDPVARHVVAFASESTHDREAYFAFWREVVLPSVDGVKRTIVCGGEVAGYIVSFIRDEKRQVGYYLGRRYWGKGLATRALGELLESLSERPIHAGVAADNVGSRRVLEKCGFVVVGETRSFARSRGEEIDEILLRLD